MMLRSRPVLTTPDSPDCSHAMHCDEVLEQRVRRALGDVGCHPFHEIQVKSDHGRITLSGTVPTYYLKQIAQSIAMRFEGVRSVENCLVVR